MPKILPIEWHRTRGEQARHINELLQDLIIGTHYQYGHPAWESRVLDSIEFMFRVWRDRMDRNQYSEIKGCKDKSYWLGKLNKFDNKGGGRGDE